MDTTNFREIIENSEFLGLAREFQIPPITEDTEEATLQDIEEVYQDSDEYQEYLEEDDEDGDGDEYDYYDDFYQPGNHHFRWSRRL